MQVKPEAEVSTLSGARQVPLMHRDQLVPGVIFTGIAADHVHELVSITGDRMQTQTLPRKALDAGHAHAFTLNNNNACRCGLNNFDVPPFLPEDGTTPKVHILVPLGPLVTPNRYSIYLMTKPDGTLVLCGGAHERPKDTEIPIITKAACVWQLPEAAQRVMQDNETSSSDLDANSL